MPASLRNRALGGRSNRPPAGGPSTPPPPPPSTEYGPGLPSADDWVLSTATDGHGRTPAYDTAYTTQTTFENLSTVLASAVAGDVIEVTSVSSSTTAQSITTPDGTAGSSLGNVLVRPALGTRMAVPRNVDIGCSYVTFAGFDFPHASVNTTAPGTVRVTRSGFWRCTFQRSTLGMNTQLPFLVACLNVSRRAANGSSYTHVVTVGGNAASTASRSVTGPRIDSCWLRGCDISSGASWKAHTIHVELSDPSGTESVQNPTIVNSMVEDSSDSSVHLVYPTGTVTFTGNYVKGPYSNPNETALNSLAVSGEVDRTNVSLVFTDNQVGGKVRFSGIGQDGSTPVQRWVDPSMIGAGVGPDTGTSFTSKPYAYLWAENTAGKNTGSNYWPSRLGATLTGGYWTFTNCSFGYLDFGTVSNVKFVNCKFTGGAGGGAIVRFGPSVGMNPSNIWFDKCEFDFDTNASQTGDCITNGSSSCTTLKVTRCYFHGLDVDGIKLQSGTPSDPSLVEDSVFMVQRSATSDKHLDCIQGDRKGSHQRIRRNYFYGPNGEQAPGTSTVKTGTGISWPSQNRWPPDGESGQSQCIIMESSNSNVYVYVGDVIIEDNYINGGLYSVNLSIDQWTLRNNAFGYQYKFGPLAHKLPESGTSSYTYVAEGNIWAEGFNDYSYGGLTGEAAWRKKMQDAGMSGYNVASFSNGQTPPNSSIAGALIPNTSYNINKDGAGSSGQSGVIPWGATTWSGNTISSTALLNGLTQSGASSTTGAADALAETLWPDEANLLVNLPGASAQTAATVHTS